MGGCVINLRVDEYKERFDENGKILLFWFEDEEGRTYRAIIPEKSEFFKVWHILATALTFTFQNKQDLWLMDAKVKTGTVELEHDQKFKYDVRDRGFTFLPKDPPPKKDWHEKN